MPKGWDSILTVISFGDCYTDGLEMLLESKEGSDSTDAKMTFLPLAIIFFLGITV